MKKVDRKLILESFLTLFLGFNILSGILGDNLLFKMRYIVAIVVIFWEIKDRKITFNINKRNIIFILLYFVAGMIPVSFYNHNTNWMFWIIQTIYLLLAYVLIVESFSNCIFNILFYVLHIISAIYFLLYFWGKQVTSFFCDVSTNYISVYYIILFVLYLMINGGENKDLKMRHLIIASTFSLFAGGRGGILSMGIIICISLFIKKSRRRNFLMATSFLLIVIVFLGINYNKAFEIFYRFAEMGMDSNGRYKFWSDYLKNCRTSFGNIVFGTNIQESLSRYYYDIPHLHSSYLTIYGYCGLVPTIYLVYIFIKQC